MRFHFNERKAAQAAAYLLQRHGGTLNYMALIKLLYLADRRTLIECGMPITGDRLVSMPHGPVLSLVYDRINMGQHETPWYEYISAADKYSVHLQSADVNADELSQYELQVLQEIDQRYGTLDQWQLRDLTHTLPEWQDPHGSSLPISPEDILRTERSPEDISRIAEEAEELWFFGALRRTTESR